MKTKPVVLKKTTYDGLLALKKGNDTFDTVVSRLLDEHAMREASKIGR